MINKSSFNVVVVAAFSFTTTTTLLKRFKVTLIEVGPRDGLQNERAILNVDDKVKFINKLKSSGLRHIEIGSFVSPKWVPQMAQTDQVCQKLLLGESGGGGGGNETIASVNYSVLIPNEMGMQQVINIKEGGAEGERSLLKTISVFTTVSESFSLKNTNCSVAESLRRIQRVMELAKHHNFQVRGYISCVTHCPYEGHMDASRVKALTMQLLQMGCYQVSLGETIGQGTVQDIRNLLKSLDTIPRSQLAVHFHDTYGQALANVLASLDYNIEFIDTSVNGLGGCPYAPGAAGNVATEEVAYMLKNLNLPSDQDDLDLDQLIEAGQFVNEQLKRSINSKLSTAWLARRSNHLKK